MANVLLTPGLKLPRKRIALWTGLAANIVVCIGLCIGCTCKTGTVIKAEKDNAGKIMENDTSLLSERHDHTIKLEEWKNSHRNEWIVVKQALDIMEGNGNIDYEETDKLVRAYIAKKNIDLPADICEQIKTIEKICESKFDIRGYDETNAGMHKAENVALMYDKYINWLLANEVEKIKDTDINIQQEEMLFHDVMVAYYDCCDSIGNAFEGTMGWVFKSSVNKIEIDFKKSMYVAMLNPQSPQNMPLLLTSKHFKDECEIQYRNFEPELNCAPSDKKVRTLLDAYSKAITNWLEYRAKVEKGISNKKLGKNYSYLTRSFAREQFVHFKNAFKDIGEHECCFLPLDCSDEE